MNTVITGGAGFIGSNLVRRLHAAGHRVVAIDDLSLGRAANIPDIELIVGDVGSRSTWAQVSDIEAIVHLAGASSTPMFAENMPLAFDNNIRGFLRVLDEARARRITRVVYASTSLIYGNSAAPLCETGPTDILNSYALSKHCMEQIAAMYAREFNVSSIGLRFMSVFGPREDHKGQMANLVSQFIWAIEDGIAPIVYGDGQQTRDFTSVWDVVQAIELLLERAPRLGTRVFNVGTGRATSLNLLIELLSRQMGVPVTPTYTRVPAGRAYNVHQQASIAALSECTSYAPSITLEEGIDEILRLRGWQSGEVNAQAV